MYLGHLCILSLISLHLNTSKVFCRYSTDYNNFFLIIYFETFTWSTNFLWLCNTWLNVNLVIFLFLLIKMPNQPEGCNVFCISQCIVIDKISFLLKSIENNKCEINCQNLCAWNYDIIVYTNILIYETGISKYKYTVT